MLYFLLLLTDDAHIHVLPSVLPPCGSAWLIPPPPIWSRAVRVRAGTRVELSAVLFPPNVRLCNSPGGQGSER